MNRAFSACCYRDQVPGAMPEANVKTRLWRQDFAGNMPAATGKQFTAYVRRKRTERIKRRR